MVNNVAVMGEIPMPTGELNVIQGTEPPQPVIMSSNTATIGHASIGAATGTSISNTSSYPWGYYYYPNYSYTVKMPWVSIDQAENGFIVVKDGKTFVCKNVAEIAKLLEKKEKE